MKWVALISTISFQTVYAQYYLPFSYESNNKLLKTYTGNFPLAGKVFTKSSGASQNFNVSHYNCNWTVNPSVHYIQGSVGVSFQTTEDAAEIIFDLTDSLRVDSVLFNDAKVSFRHAANVVNIDFGQTIPAQSQNLVTIYYQGRPPVNGFGSYITTLHSGVPVLWTLSEPYGSRNWWPCKDGLLDKADSIDVYITTSAVYTSVSNGLRVQQTVTGDMKTTHWKHRYPIATYLVCMAVTNYSEFVNEWDVPGGPLMMQTFCYPENLDIFMRETPKAYDAMQFFSRVIGSYPFIKEKYGHVQFGFRGGEEHQTSTFVFWPDESLMAHEMAHQWFGDKVTCKSWKHIWLNEGFATHLASMYMEQKYPETTIPMRKTEIETITSVADGSVFVTDTTVVGRIFDNRLSYLKGSHLLYMLRLILGDSTFFKGIRSYLNDPELSYGYAVTSDLQRHLEQASGLQLDYFFNEWFYGQGYPSYHLEWWQQSEDITGVRVSQTTSAPSVIFFHLPVPIRLMAGGQSKDFMIHPDFNGQIFYLKSAFIPDSIKVDPDYQLITKGNTMKKIDRPANQQIIKIFPNPVSDMLNIHINGFEETKMSLRLFDVAGKQVLKQVFDLNGSLNTTLNTLRLASGIYFMKITTGSGYHKVFKIRK